MVEFPEINPEAIRDSLNEQFVMRAREDVRVRTGDLRDSIRVEGTQVVADEPYAGYIEEYDPYMEPAIDAAEIDDEVVFKS